MNLRQRWQLQPPSPSSDRPPRRRRSRRRVKAKDSVIIRIQYEVRAISCKLKAASWLHWLADASQESQSSSG